MEEEKFLWPLDREKERDINVKRKDCREKCAVQRDFQPLDYIWIERGREGNRGDI